MSVAGGFFRSTPPQPPDLRCHSTGEHFEYAYDAVGNRTVMTDATGVTTSTYDAANRLPSVGGVTNPGPTLYLVGHETLGRWDGSEWAYHLPDALGSVRQVADSAGAVMSVREWTP